jgi:ABC-2 type transport system permease protein
MTQIIQDARHVLVSTSTDTVWTMVANPAIMLVPIAIVLLLAVLSIVYFRKSSKHFAEMV